MSRYYENYWPPYISVAERRLRAARKLAEMKKTGRNIAPVKITGRKITSTFWGNAWCKNLEAYSDYANRLPRGRSYVRNGSVMDLQIAAGHVQALVNGTDLYTVDINIKPLPKKKWTMIKDHCAGQIGSLVELLKGSISKSIMEIVTRKGEGLFPSPREITLRCSCPDWAAMCKHVAATLFGVGARLDHNPELLFTLRGVDPTEMLETAIDQPARAGKARKGRVLKTAELSSVFGVDIDIDGEPSIDSSTTAGRAGRKRLSAQTRKTAASKTNTKKNTAKKATKKKGAAKKGAAKKGAPQKNAAKKYASKKKNTVKKANLKKAAKKAAKKTTANKLPPKNATGKNATAKTTKKPGKKTTAKTTAGKTLTAKKKVARKAGR